MVTCSWAESTDMSLKHRNAWQRKAVYSFINRKFPCIYDYNNYHAHKPNALLFFTGCWTFILLLHLITPSTQTSMSTTLATPATTPPKKVPTPRGALSVAVCIQEENKPANIIRHHTSIKTCMQANEYPAQRHPCILITITSIVPKICMINAWNWIKCTCIRSYLSQLLAGHPG